MYNITRKQNAYITVKLSFTSDLRISDIFYESKYNQRSNKNSQKEYYNIIKTIKRQLSTKGSYVIKGGIIVL